MNWQAIGIGAAVGIAIGLAWNLLVTALIARNPEGWQPVVYFGYAVGVLADIAVGATAGWIAARRGALHGALADLIAVIGGFAIGIVMALTRKQGLEFLTMPQYWLHFVPVALLGVGIAAIAGFPAAALAAKRRREG